MEALQKQMDAQKIALESLQEKNAELEHKLRERDEKFKSELNEA